MSLEIKNLNINVKIEPDESMQTPAVSVKDDILKECRQLIESSINRNQER
jgi:hypothetical protein